MPDRLVNGLQRINIEEAERIKRLNHCKQVPASSPRWHIYYGTADRILLPPPLMMDVVSKMMVYEIPRQALLIFESSGEAYVVLCQFNLCPEVLKIAVLQGSEAAFAMVSQLAPG